MNALKMVNNALSKTVVALCAVMFLPAMLSVQAVELQSGVGELSVKGGLLGLESSVDSTATVVTLKEQHANLLSTDLFYNFSLSTYRSSRFQNETNRLSTLGGGDISLPNTNFDWQGLDAQVTLGYDLIKKSPTDYFGVGLTLGIAAPYIDNTGRAAGSISETTTLVPTGTTQSVDLFDSKTEFNGHKLGPKILFGKSLNRLASVYGEVSYAWQNLQVKNSTLDFSTNVDGDYFSYELGMRYQPYTSKKDIGFMTLEPSLYFTVGVNYSQSSLDSLKVDLSGQQFKLDSGKMDMSSTTLNFGVGYSF